MTLSIGTFSNFSNIEVPQTEDFVCTDGYRYPGDGGHAFYAVTSVADPSGWRARSADGRWWQIVVDGPVTPEQFGCVGDGVADDALAANEMNNYLNSIGGGIVLAYRRYRIASTNLVLYDNVGWQGLFSKGSGLRYFVTQPNKRGNYYNEPSTIVLNPAFTIQLWQNTSFSGMVVMREGMSVPTSIRAFINAVRNFSGTAITVGNNYPNLGVNASIADCFVIGFHQLLQSGVNNAVRIINVIGDCINGIWVDGTADLFTINECKLEPFILSYLEDTTGQYSITDITESPTGGIRITTGTTTQIVTGDLVHVGQVEIAPSQSRKAASGRYIATVIDGNTIDLQGSTFDTPYGGGGNLYLAEAAIRQGIAYRVEGQQADGVQISNCFAYGFDTTLRLGNGSNATHVTGIFSDANLNLEEQSTIDLDITGTANYSSIIGGMTSSHGIQIRCDTPDTNFHTIAFLPLQTVSAAPASIVHLAGSLNIVGCAIDGNVLLGDNIQAIKFTNCDNFGIKFSGNPIALEKISLIANRNRLETGGLSLYNGMSIGLGTLDQNGLPRNDITIDNEKISVRRPLDIYSVTVADALSMAGTISANCIIGLVDGDNGEFCLGVMASNNLYRIPLGSPISADTKK
ncbi:MULTISPECIES: hypothetical protein [Cupriavidus]